MVGEAAEGVEWEEELVEASAAEVASQVAEEQGEGEATAGVSWVWDLILWGFATPTSATHVRPIGGFASSAGLPVKAEYLDLCLELEALLGEAAAAEPIVFPPSKKHVQATLDRMSSLAHQQTQSAQRLGTRSALKLAAKTHMRVAHAATLHGLTSLAKTHLKVSKALHNGNVEKLAKVARTSDKKKKRAGEKAPGHPIERAGQKAKPPIIPAAAQRPVIGTRGH